MKHRRKSKLRRCFIISIKLLSALFNHFAVVAEKETDAPQTAETDNSEDYSRNDFTLTAEQPADKVEAEQTDKTPVDRTDDYERKRDFIKNLHERFLLPALFCAVTKKIFIDFRNKKL